jgi:DNA-directed RNA polymerase subunit RPC12/RpoP
MTNEQTIERWNEEVAELPELTESTEYECQQCCHNFTLIEGNTEIGAWGMEVCCPKCGHMVKYERLGYSEFE